MAAPATRAIPCDSRIAILGRRDPHVLEINLEAKQVDLEILPGKRTPIWTYNGQLPGPLLRAQVGDRVIVHFKNSLPVETTIHWHGLRISNDMDGAPGVTQAPIAPGAEFRYEFVLKDAGTYWYHPHVDSAVQVGRGLYGPIVVEDPNDPKAFGDDLVLMLSDMSLDEEGQPLPGDNGGQFGNLFGREGSTLLVNGKVVPHLEVRTGKQQRWRIVNPARARYFNLRLPGHRFVRLGGDNGLAARSEDVYNVVVAPGERADAVFTTADPPGSHKVLQWVPFDRGYGSTFNRPREDLLAIDTVDAPAVLPAPIPETLRTARARRRRTPARPGTSNERAAPAPRGPTPATKTSLCAALPERGSTSPSPAPLARRAAGSSASTRRSRRGRSLGPSRTAHTA